MLDAKLIDGEDGQYGLYVKTVNGITADYDVDQTYWGFYIEDEMVPYGVSDAKITGGEHYKFIYTK